MSDVIYTIAQVETLDSGAQYSKINLSVAAEYNLFWKSSFLVSADDGWVDISALDTILFSGDSVIDMWNVITTVILQINSDQNTQAKLNEDNIFTITSGLLLSGSYQALSVKNISEVESNIYVAIYANKTNNEETNPFLLKPLYSGMSFNNTSAEALCYTELPPSENLLEYSFEVTSAYGMRISAVNNDIILDGVDEITSIESVDVDATLTLIANGSGQWVVDSKTGTWT